MIRKHHYKIGQEVWFYTTDTLEVHHGIVDDIEFDDEDNNYVYEINTNAVPDEDDRIYHVYPSAMRANEYEAHSLFSGYLDMVTEQAEAEYHNYRELLTKELDWMRNNEDKRPDA